MFEVGRRRKRRIWNEFERRRGEDKIGVLTLDSILGLWKKLWIIDSGLSLKEEEEK